MTMRVRPPEGMDVARAAAFVGGERVPHTVDDGLVRFSLGGAGGRSRDVVGHLRAGRALREPAALPDPRARPARARAPALRPRAGGRRSSCACAAAAGGSSRRSTCAGGRSRSCGCGSSRARTAAGRCAARARTGRARRGGGAPARKLPQRAGDHRGRRPRRHRRRDRAARARLRRPRRPGRRARHGRDVVPQHVPGLRVRRPEPPLLVLLRAAARLVAAVLAAGRDPLLRPLRRARARRRSARGTTPASRRAPGTTSGAGGR